MESRALAVFCDLISACKTLQRPWVSSRKGKPSICHGYVKHKYFIFPLKEEQQSIHPSVRPSIPAPPGGQAVCLPSSVGPGTHGVPAGAAPWGHLDLAFASLLEGAHLTRSPAVAAGAPEHPRSLRVAAAAWHR